MRYRNPLSQVVQQQLLFLGYAPTNQGLLEFQQDFNTMINAGFFVNQPWAQLPENGQPTNETTDRLYASSGAAGSKFEWECGVGQAWRTTCRPKKQLPSGHGALRPGPVGPQRPGQSSQMVRRRNPPVTGRLAPRGAKPAVCNLGKCTNNEKANGGVDVLIPTVYHYEGQKFLLIEPQCCGAPEAPSRPLTVKQRNPEAKKQCNVGNCTKYESLHGGFEVVVPKIFQQDGKTYCCIEQTLCCNAPPTPAQPPTQTTTITPAVPRHRRRFV